MSRPFYELTPDDVGKPFVRVWGRMHWVSHFLGRIMPQDVGKRIYLVGDVVQVENDEQRKRRVES